MSGHEQIGDINWPPEALPMQDHERVAVYVVATAVHRVRNPKAGDFTPGTDAGHRRLLDAALGFLRDPYGVGR